MSDDEFGGLHDGRGNPSDRDKRSPRFSWTPAYEATFFRSLCESVQLGLRENHSFKGEAWDRAAAALREQHGAYPTKNHLVNKSDNARKKFRLWRGLREHPDFIYTPATRTVTGSDESWRGHIEVGLSSAGFLFFQTSLFLFPLLTVCLGGATILTPPFPFLERTPVPRPPRPSL